MRVYLLASALLVTGCLLPDVPAADAPDVPAPAELVLGPQVMCAEPAEDPDLPGFVDVTEAGGVAHLPDMPEWNQGLNGITSVRLEATGGFIVADLDGDALLDLMFSDFVGPPRFYFGQGDLRFTERSAADIGVETDSRQVNGGSAADFDGDGDLDIWLGTYVGGLLFRNDGQGRFEDVTDALGVRGAGNQISGAWADPDRDGDLDLYVAAHSPGSPSPGQPYENDPDHLWIQSDDGTFNDAAPALYPTGEAGQGFIGGWFDSDGDGWQDLYVVNDGGFGMGDMTGPPNRYFVNDGGTLAGAPEAGTDIGMLSMGLALGDMDNDGDIDAHVSNAGPTLLLRNEGDHLFTDISLGVAGFSDGSAGDISWGTIFFDHDNDGVLELHTSFGHMPTKADGGPLGTMNREEMPDQLWRLEGGGWTDIAGDVGVDDPAWSRAAQAVDLDGDGFAELISWSLDQGPRINHARCSERAWLTVQLEDATSPNRFAIGARITATGEGTPLVLREIGAGSTGVMSGGPPSARLGLNGAESVDLDVRWPDGTTDRFADVPTRQQLRITR